MTNPTIETDITEILNEFKTDLRKILEKVSNLETGQAEIKGEIKSLDTKLEQVDKRVANQEFQNRGIFVTIVAGVLLALLIGTAKLLGWTS